MWSSDKQKIESATAGLSGFVPTRSCVGADQKTALAVDEVARRLCAITVGEGRDKGSAHTVQAQVASYQDIAESRVMEDQHVLAVCSSPQAGTDADLSGGRRTGNTVSTLVLQLNLKVGSSTLTHTVQFLKKPVKQDSPAYQKALSEIKDWHRLIAAMIQLDSLMRTS